MIAKTIVTLQTNVARSPLRTVRIGTGLALRIPTDARARICTGVKETNATKMSAVAKDATLGMASVPLGKSAPITTGIHFMAMKKVGLGTNVAYNDVLTTSTGLAPRICLYEGTTIGTSK